MIEKRVIMDLARTSPYLVRWSLSLPFGLSLKLHLILRPDDDRCAHDHPWWFVRIILWGGYWEEWSRDSGDSDDRLRIIGRSHRKPWRPWAPWRFYYCGHDFSHRITELPRGRSWTLVLCGRRSRDWGFYTRTGWMAWRAFVSAAWSQRVLWCEDGRVLNPESQEKPIVESR